MAADRPLLLVDVDGVLNPFPHGPADPTPEGFDPYVLDGYHVWLSPTHGDWLRELATVFELVWGTTWEDRANVLIAPILGLPTLPVVHFDRSGGGWVEKLPDVRVFLDHDRAAAWIDDMHGPAEFAWADARPAPTLLIHTDGRVGMTRPDVDRLLHFGRTLEPR